MRQAGETAGRGKLRWRAGGAAFLLFLLLTPAVASDVSAAPMGEADARHLLARTGFGPTAAEIRAWAPLERRAAIERVLASARTTPLTAPPASMSDASPLRPPPGASEAERSAFRREQVRTGIELRGWWLGEMLATDSPLTERMTLFWHNHFVSSQQKVRVTRLMARQNLLLRQHALGDFGALLHAVSKDAAMLVYLDGVQNRRAVVTPPTLAARASPQGASRAWDGPARANPNENFAREVMELFTLGEGHYTETDVKEAARAFSGWSLDRETGAYLFRPALHDRGEKTILGQRGRFDGDGVLDLLLAQPATAEFVVAKLWREFVSPEPDPAEVKRIAGVFRVSGHRIPVALRELLATAAFWAPEQRGVLVRSPVELVVGTLRSIEVHPADVTAFAFATAGMGQNLFSPPNVKGWRGGEAWIDTNTLLARKAFVEQLARYEESRMMLSPSAPGALRTASLAHRLPREAVVPEGLPTGDGDEDAKLRTQRIARALDRAFRELGFSATRWVASMPGATPAEKRAAAQAVLLAIPPAAAGERALGDDPLAFVRQTMLDPAYQLK